MTKLIPFPARRVRRTVKRLLTLSAPCDLGNRPQVWRDRPVPPETLGRLLQQLAIERPLAVLLFENLAADMLAELARERD